MASIGAQAAERTGLAGRPEQTEVVGGPRAELRRDHEDLEAGVSLPNELWQLRDRRLARVRDDDVEGEVDERPSRGIDRTLCRLEETLARRLLGEREDRRNAAGRRVPGAGGHRFEALTEMRVHVDDAGEHQLPASVDLGACGPDLTDLRDPFAGDAHIGARLGCRGHDGAAADRDIEHAPRLDR